MSMLATGRVASYGIKAVMNVEEILLNCHDVEHDGDEGEEWSGDTQGRRLNLMGKWENGERTRLKQKKRRDT